MSEPLQWTAPATMERLLGGPRGTVGTLPINLTGGWCGVILFPEEINQSLTSFRYKHPWEVADAGIVQFTQSGRHCWQKLSSRFRIGLDPAIRISSCRYI